MDITTILAIWVISGVLGWLIMFIGLFYEGAGDEPISEMIGVLLVCIILGSGILIYIIGGIIGGILYYSILGMKQRSNRTKREFKFARRLKR